MCSGASLNHIYRSVWNPSLGAMVAVAEISPTCSGSGRASGTVVGARTASGLLALSGPRALAAALALAFSAVPWVAQANPTGGVAIVGQASMATSGNQLTVTTQNGAGTNHSAINWQSFSIPQGNSTYFQQPGAASTVINRVVTNTPSQIFGTLGSNGSLLLVNQSGITVGAGAVVDTAGFTASALRMSDADALAGRLRFGDVAGSDAAVSVFGNILARSGDVVLLGSQVSTGQDALIQAPNGSAILAAGQQIEITARGLEGITLQVQAPTDQAINLGSLQAGAVGMFAGTLRHSGEIRANSISQEGGKVVLKAMADTYVEGAGKILATGTVGGSVDVLGNRVAVMDQALIDVSGEQGGGAVRVGGDYQGKNPGVRNANMTYFGSEASIRADATANGDGGKVIVWADDTTRFFGDISARGGAQSGDGGFVEVSGKRYLDFQGTANTSATYGRAGTLLLDPSDITISADLTPSGFSTTQTPFVADDSFIDTSSVLGVSVLEAALANGSVEVDASTGGYAGYVGSITVASPVAWTNGNSLTLTADGSININASITAASGTLNLNAGSGDGPAISQGYGGSITAATLKATTSGNYADITLTEANSVGTASFAAGPAGFYGGDVSFTNTRALRLGNVTAYSLTVDTNTGNGAISQSAGTKILLYSQGGADFNAGSGNLTLMNSGNEFGRLDITNAGIARINNSGSDIYLAGNGISADSFTLTTTGNVDSYPRFDGTGVLSITSGGYINLCGDGCPVISVDGAITLKAAGDLEVGNYSSPASGNAITLISGGLFTASSSSGTVDTPNGRWLLYLDDPIGSGESSHTFGQYSLDAGDFKQYNAPSGTKPAALLGDGHLFSVAPILTATLGGSVTKVYDGGLSIGLSGATYALSIDAEASYGDDISGASLSGGAGRLDDPNVGSGKLVTASGVKVSGVVSYVGDSQIPVYGYRATATGNIGEVTPAQLISSIDLFGSRVYDGTNIVNANIFSLSGLVNGETLGLTGSGTVADKNVGANKPVSLGSLALADGTGLASNYTFSGGTQVATITPAAITGVSGLTAANKVYDGTTVATVTAASASLIGLFGGDSVTLSAANGISGVFSDKNAGLGKTVNITGLSLEGADASNYTLDSAAALAFADISVRPLSTWLGTSGNWSDAANWDALPDASNVLAVVIPAGAAVVYDAAVGTTRLRTLTSSGSLTLAGGVLDIANVLSTPRYTQTAGALDGAGALVVDGSFSQSGGTIDLGGAVAITQSAGDLEAGQISAALIELAAPGGTVTQSGALTTAGVLDVTSLSGSLLNDAGNRVSAFRASASAAGNIALTNTGVLDVQGITTASGNITLNNTGGVSTSGLVKALNGILSITANSPLTIGTSGISSSGNINLAATNLTSAGNMALDGPVTSTAGSINMSAANNFVQNSAVSAAGSVTASAGGSITFGPGATTVGNPVLYSAGGVPVASPFNPVAATQTLITETVIRIADFSVDFEQILLPLIFEDEPPVAEIATNVANEITGAPLAGAAPKQDRFILVLEGSICTP
jgi:filamentous hemagglutinin family protein